jgi:hypothetical protein
MLPPRSDLQAQPIYNKVIYSAASLQAMSLRVIDYAVANDVQFAVDEYFANAFLACALVVVLNIGWRIILDG